MRNKSGISLIVLVITIIVMIVLAGTIIISLSNNGIITKAEEAVGQTNEKTLEQEVTTQLLLGGWYKGKKITQSDLDALLSYMPKDTKITNVADGTWEIQKDSAVITLYETGDIVYGKMPIWDGKTSSVPKVNSGNWYIYIAEEMKFLADFVNNGNQLTETQKTMVSSLGYNEADYVIDETTTIHLMNNLDFGARQENGVWTTETQWTPIGDNTNKLLGTFDGNSHFITGVYIQETRDYVGFIGSTEQIKDLTIKNSYVETTGQAIGALAGGARIVTNCHNENTTVVQKGEWLYIGGLIGGLKTEGVIDGCTNSGIVTAEGGAVGGVLGHSNTSGRVSNCTNTGTVSGSNAVSGVVGRVNKSSNVTNCINTGNVTGQGVYIGGVLGIALTDSNDPSTAEPTKISYCSNSGSITGLSVGGVVGSVSQYKSIVDRCYNTGKVESVVIDAMQEMKDRAYAGGIVGSFGRGAKVQNCYNTATVTGTRCVSGILGVAFINEGANTPGEIINSYSIGEITGETYVGGLIGNNGNATTITNSYYLTGTAEVDEGSGTAADLMKDSTFIKGTFLTNANSAESIWEIRGSENNGYPVLIGLK